ncbi:sulfotransferase domain-containing protein [Primorskyibacter sp. 2E233]|uniref:sulfotransferase domain-containing protein n=1 Tax=Primorskyibacter sp. 2E233 TaxID=3413431 RepID=UPI003BF1E2BD
MLTPFEPAQTTYSGPESDPARWNSFEPRAGDIVVNTPPKSGTTWTQGILAMLISGQPDVDAQTSMKSPWIDMKLRPLEDVLARLAAQDHRRQVKSHTPFDGLPYWSELRYITVYRNPIDVHFSFRNHVRNMNIDLVDALYPDDPSESFRIFLRGDHGEGSLAGVVNHYTQTLAREDRGNLLRLHYADMTRDLAAAVAKIADHVGITHPPELMAAIVDAARFDSMKANAHRFTPSAGQGFWKADAGFFDSATSNKWEGQLTKDDLAAYDAAISDLLTPEERVWLEWGSAGATAA